MGTEISQIAVEPGPEEGKYRMTAVIDGQTYSHEITQKEYDKFLATDDYHRTKLFAKIFSEAEPAPPSGNKQRTGHKKFLRPFQQVPWWFLRSCIISDAITGQSVMRNITMGRVLISNPVLTLRGMLPSGISRHR